MSQMLIMHRIINICDILKKFLGRSLRKLFFQKRFPQIQLIRSFAVTFKLGAGYLVTLVERKTRFLTVELVDNKKSDTVRFSY